MKDWSVNGTPPISPSPCKTVGIWWFHFRICVKTATKGVIAGNFRTASSEDGSESNPPHRCKNEKVKEKYKRHQRERKRDLQED